MNEVDPAERRALVDRAAAAAGLTVTESRWVECEDAILRAAEDRGIDGIEELLNRLSDDPTLVHLIADAITVAETYFMRFPKQFDEFRKLVVPCLKKKALSMPTAVWSAGCSTGEEPYSIAIVLFEEGLEGVATVLGTDVSRTALERAQKAEYGKWSFRGVDDEIKHRHFTPSGDRLSLNPEIRKLVTFKQHNLEDATAPPSISPDGRFDTIFCRNVLMYLGRKSAPSMARYLYDRLADGGWLFTGPFDPPLWDHAPFTTEITSAGIVYRRPLPDEMEAEDTSDGKGDDPGGGHEVPEVLPAPDWRSLKHLRQATIEGALPRSQSILVRNAIRSGSHRRALNASRKAAEAYPLSPEAHLLHGKALLEAGDTSAAIAALRKALYLDRHLAAAQFLLGEAAIGQDKLLAQRAYATAADLCESLPALEAVPFCGNSTAGSLAVLARQRLSRLAEEQRAD